MRTILIMTRLTFQEAARRKILWAALLLGSLFLLVYGLGFHYARLDVQNNVSQMNAFALKEIFSFFSQAGLYAVNFLNIGMSILISVDTLSGEIARGTIQTLVAKPLRRSQIVLGKWLGLLSMMSLYLLMMGGGTLLIVYLVADFTIPNPASVISLLWLNGALFLSLVLFGGTFLSTLTNGITAFGLFGIAFVGGWVEHVGAFLGNVTVVRVGIISSLIFPSEALWKRAAHQMQTPLVEALGFSPFTSTSMPSVLMVVYAGLYAIVLLGLAIRRFSQRDL